MNYFKSGGRSGIRNIAYQNDVSVEVSLNPNKFLEDNFENDQERKFFKNNSYPYKELYQFTD